MLRMDLSKVKEGMKLALPVRHPNSPTRCLLKVNYELTPLSCKRLVQMGIRFVWVQYPALSYLKEFINSDVVEAQSVLVANIGDCFDKIQRDTVAKIPFHIYTASIGTMVSKLIGNPQAAIFLGDLLETDADDLMRHASTVSYLSILMGLKLEGYLVKQRKHIPPARAKEVNNLGIGAMLHDVGILKLDPQTRAKYEETGDDTDPAWQEHVSLGYELVRGKLKPSASTIVLHHHQRFDGEGYAGKKWPQLTGERIHIFARVCAIADTFDRFRFPVVGHSRPTVQAMRMLLKPDMLASFDPRVLRAFFIVVPPYAPGSILKLSDGRYATAIDHNTQDPCRPTIQIIPDPHSIQSDDKHEDELPIDMAKDAPNLMIVECDGACVQDMNFEAPKFLLDDSLTLNWV